MDKVNIDLRDKGVKLISFDDVISIQMNFINAKLDKENDRIIIRHSDFEDVVIHNLTGIELMCRYCEVEAFGRLVAIEF